MILTIFKKELKDTLRDKRTLMMMIVIPVMIFPVIMTLYMKVSESFSEKANRKVLHIGVVAGNDGKEFVQALNDLPGNKKVIMFSDTALMQDFIKQDSLQFGIFVPVDYEARIKSRKTSNFKVYHNASELGMQARADSLLGAIAMKETMKRYAELNVNVEELTPITYDFHNVASDKETFGKLIGGFLPYLFIVFGFVGCMYPTIDLFTGEKERGTLETLLTTPISRWQILLGKMGVVILSGLMAATFTLVGIFLSIEVFNVVKEAKILEIIHEILTLKFLVLMYLLLIPLITFFAGVMIPIAVYAKTFKEAQSIITPLNMVMILPAMIGFFPGIELNAVTACIPVVNVVLATKDLIAGTLDLGLLALSFGVMATLAGIMISISYRRFDRESNIIS